MTSRGEVHPQRPDLRQGWSAPAVGNRVPGSPPANLNPLRTNNERPISFSTFAPNAAQLPPRPPPHALANQKSQSFHAPGHAAYDPQPSPEFRRPPEPNPRPGNDGPPRQQQPVAVHR